MKVKTKIFPSIESKEYINSETFFIHLDSEMHARRFLHDNPALNPEISPDRLRIVVGEYSGLIYSIVGFLVKARWRLKDFKDVACELDRNIAEERGSRTDGRSHQAIFQEALADEKGINLSDMAWREKTLKFLSRIDDVLVRSTPSVVAGITYALEATATPELQIVSKVLSKIPSIKGGKDIGSKLDKFILMHVDDFEPGHRDRLAKTLSLYLEKGVVHSHEFEKGFRIVLDAMDEWWSDLALINN